MSPRASISRREPVLALEEFRYRGRNYKEGSFLDRRRTRMPNSRLRKYLRVGLCILAKDVDPESLEAWGWRYDNKAPRNKLVKIEDSLIAKNQRLIDEFDREDADPEMDATETPTLKHVGGGWYDVMIKGEPVNDPSLRKDLANDLVKSLLAGE